ncbi:hypothetical protein [Sporosarcina sp. JAI121]|uniref:hypothetical protein n=1 Tax=Sporosarcina sp. JAI121 TaxID=2723064 RepID=UPI0015C85084|nr:hypothetical protein [Sporosarcina sp. JAI121]NYF26386.1 hypothetical protein [Sporosarcina sp. JAI121]
MFTFKLMDTSSFYSQWGRHDIVGLERNMIGHSGFMVGLDYDMIGQPGYIAGHRGYTVGSGVEERVM